MTAGAVHGGKGGTDGLEDVHEHGDAGGRSTTQHSHYLGDLVEHAADENADADDGAQDDEQAVGGGNGGRNGGQNGGQRSRAP